MPFPVARLKLISGGSILCNHEAAEILTNIRQISIRRMRQLVMNADSYLFGILSSIWSLVRSMTIQIQFSSRSLYCKVHNSFVWLLESIGFYCSRQRDSFPSAVTVSFTSALNCWSPASLYTTDNDCSIRQTLPTHCQPCIVDTQLYSTGPQLPLRRGFFFLCDAFSSHWWLACPHFGATTHLSSLVAFQAVNNQPHLSGSSYDTSLPQILPYRLIHHGSMGSIL
jgi:hypothetical protein